MRGNSFFPDKKTLKDKFLPFNDFQPRCEISYWGQILKLEYVLMALNSPSFEQHGELTALN